MKEHDRTTTKRIQDNRLRVSLLKNTKILIPVHIISQEVFHQLLQVSHIHRHGTRLQDGTICEKYVQLQDVYPKSHHSKLSISAITSPSALNPINPDQRVYKKVYKRKKSVFPIETPSKWQSHKESNFICQFDNKSSYFLNFQHLVEL